MLVIAIVSAMLPFTAFPLGFPMDFLSPFHGVFGIMVFVDETSEYERFSIVVTLRVFVDANAMFLLVGLCFR